MSARPSTFTPGLFSRPEASTESFSATLQHDAPEPVRQTKASPVRPSRGQAAQGQRPSVNTTADTLADTPADTSANASAKTLAKASAVWITAHCDGGSRGNPGPAGYGVQVTAADGSVMAELSEFLGVRTNNFAEYSGLLGSLAYAIEHGYRRLKVISDSELMVKQIQGKYQVKSPDLKPLYEEARRRIAQLERFEITHALRHKNKDADRLANEAMDRGMSGRGAAGTSRVITSSAAMAGGVLPAVRVSASVAVPVVERTDRPMWSAIEVREEAAKPLIPIARPDRPAATAAAPVSAQSGSDASGFGASGAIASDRPAAGMPTSTMLRGFTRDGVVHILGGGAKLPDGIFVKVIPE